MRPAASAAANRLDAQQDITAAAASPAAAALDEAGFTAPGGTPPRQPMGSALARTTLA
jgi:hypothetical protein